MTQHYPWCDRKRCMTDHDGTVWHIQAPAEVTTNDGPLSVGLLRIDTTTWVDLRLDTQGVCLTADEARHLSGLLAERAALITGGGS